MGCPNLVPKDVTIRGRQGRHFCVEKLMKVPKLEVGTFKNNY